MLTLAIGSTIVMFVVLVLLVIDVYLGQNNDDPPFGGLHAD